MDEKVESEGSRVTLKPLAEKQFQPQVSSRLQSFEFLARAQRFILHVHMEKSLKKKFTKKHKIVLGGDWTTNIALIAFNSRLEHARPLLFYHFYSILFHFMSLPLVRNLKSGWTWSVCMMR